MVMTFSAIESDPQPGTGRITNSFSDILREIFLILHAPFSADHSQTVVARGNALLTSRLRK